METREKYSLMPVNDIRTLGQILAASGYFSDAKSEAQAVVKILAGRELGIGPVASMTGIHIIQGKPAIGAGLIASLVKRSGRYNFRVKTLSDTEASIEFFENGQPIGTSTFTEADAKRAGTQNMGKFPRNMLFARAMSNGVRWFCPDVFMGAVYEPGELGAEVNYETGEVIDTQAMVIETAPEPQPVPEPNGRPWLPETLREMLQKKAGLYRSKSNSWLAPPQNGLRGAMVDSLDDMLGGEDARHDFLRVMFGDPSSKTMDHAAVKAVMDWLDKDRQMAGEEARRVVNAEIRKEMVGELFNV